MAERCQACMLACRHELVHKLQLRHEGALLTGGWAVSRQAVAHSSSRQAGALVDWSPKSMQVEETRETQERTWCSVHTRPPPPLPSPLSSSVRVYMCPSPVSTLIPRFMSNRAAMLMTRGTSSYCAAYSSTTFAPLLCPAQERTGGREHSGLEEWMGQLCRQGRQSLTLQTLAIFLEGATHDFDQHIGKCHHGQYTRSNCNAYGTQYTWSNCYVMHIMHLNVLFAASTRAHTPITYQQELQASCAASPSRTALHI